MLIVINACRKKKWVELNNRKFRFIIHIKTLSAVGCHKLKITIFFITLHENTVLFYLAFISIKFLFRLIVYVK